MRKSEIFLLLLCFQVTSLFGQIGDSTYTIAALKDSVSYYRGKNIQVYKEYIDLLYTKGEEQKDDFYRSVATTELGFYYYIKSETDSANLFLDQALIFLEGNQVDSVKEQRINILVFKALTAQLDYKYLDAIKLWRKVGEESIEIQREVDIRTSKVMLANIYMSGEKYDQAFEYFQAGRPNVNSLDHQDIEMLGWWHGNIGECYYYTNQPDKAIIHWDSAMVIWNHLDMTRAKAYLYNFYGDFYLNDDPEKSLQQYRNGLEAAISLDNKPEYLRAQMGIGAYYEKSNQINSAAHIYLNALEYGISSGLNDKMIPALDFFIKHPKFHYLLPLSINDLAAMRIDAQDLLYEKNAAKDIGLADAIHQIELTEQREENALESASRFKRLATLLAILSIVSVGLIILTLRITKRLRSYSKKIEEQAEKQKGYLDHIEELNSDLGVRVMKLKEQGDTLSQKNKELEDILIERSKVISRLENFAFILSHDMKEPIRAVFSFAQLLEKRISNKLNNTDQEMFSFIFNGAHRAHDMINALYQYSNNTLAIMNDFEEIDLNDIIKQVVDDLRIVIDEKQATVQYDDFPKVRGQQVLLRRLFQNLISNSLKYSRAAIPPEIYIERKDEAEVVHVSVKDNGSGILKEDQDNIFKLFKRGSNTSKKKGLGIGLAICKEIVTVHGGDIYLKSTPNKGTTVTFVLDKSRTDSHPKLTRSVISNR